MSALVGEDHSVTGVGIEDKAMGHLDSYHQIDCTQRDQLAVLDFEVDRIFVFAGLTGTHTGFSEYDSFLDRNDRVLLNILDAVRLSGHKPRIVFPSTRLVYKGLSKTPLVETAQKEAKTVYAQNKLSCESYLRMFANAFEIDYTVFRICVPYGNAFDGEYSYGTIGFFLKTARSGNNISLYGDGTMMRTFTHVLDLTTAMITALESSKSVNQVYNIGGNDAITLLEVATLIAKKYGVGVEFSEWPEAAKKIESGDTIFDDSKIRELPGLQYNHNIADWINGLD